MLVWPAWAGARVKLLKGEGHIYIYRDYAWMNSAVSGAQYDKVILSYFTIVAISHGLVLGRVGLGLGLVVQQISE